MVPLWGGGGGGGKGRFPRERSSISDLEDRIIRSGSPSEVWWWGTERKKYGGKEEERERREEEERRAILRRSSIPRTARNPERATVLEPTPETMSAGRVAVLGALTQRTSPQAINEAFA